MRTAIEKSAEVAAENTSRSRGGERSPSSNAAGTTIPRPGAAHAANAGADLPTPKLELAFGPELARDRPRVETMIRSGQRNENALTNAVFYDRHPRMSGKPIVTGSPLAAEWLSIRNDIVRPALASSAVATTPQKGNTADPGMVDRGIEAVSDVADAASRLTGSVVGAVTSMARSAYDTVTSWVAGEESDIQTRPPAPPAAPESTFHSQRDNTFVGKLGIGEQAGGDVTGDVECNVTTLAMQLHTLAGSEQRVRTAACDLLEKKYHQTLRPGDRDKAQLEDLILRRFFLPEWASGTKWKQLSDAGTKPFYKGWYEDPHQAGTIEPKKFHQHAYCLSYVAAEFTPYITEIGAIKTTDGKTTDGKDCCSKEYYKETLKPVLDAGGSVMLGTNISSSGHVVLLVAVDDDGIVINDPYGLALGRNEYLRNGDSTTTARTVFKAFPKAKDVLKRRAKVNAAHLTALDTAAATLPGNMGERVHFNWDDVKAMSIGKWNNAASKAAP